MFTFGFYNSKNGDRKYNATHLGKMFDGIIQDGVLGTVGDAFRVDSNDNVGASKLTAIINPGKAWLANTWNILDAKMVVSFNSVNAGRKRTDAIVIEVNNNYDSTGYTSRTNQIKVIEGTPVTLQTDNTPPALTQVWNANQTERRIWQYPIAYITIYGTDYNGGTVDTVFTKNEVNVNNIENRVNVEGATEADKYVNWTPFVTGATMLMNLEDYLPNYSDMLKEVTRVEEAKFNSWFEQISTSIAGNFVQFVGDVFQDFITYYEYNEDTGKYFPTEDTEPSIDPVTGDPKIYYLFDTSESMVNIQNELDNKFKYGEGEVPDSLQPGQVYFQIH